MPLSTPKNVRKAKKYMRKAVRAQLENKGFSMVEVLAACPVQWHMTPLQALKHIDDEVVNIYPPGVFVDRVDEKPAAPDAEDKTAEPAASQAAGATPT